MPLTKHSWIGLRAKLIEQLMFKLGLQCVRGTNSEAAARCMIAAPSFKVL